jgi:hypothetical protein
MAIIGMVEFRIPLHICVLVQAYLIAERVALYGSERLVLRWSDRKD